jgi:hypothetical protein
VIDLDQRRRQQARHVVFEDYRRRRARAWIQPHGASMQPLIGSQTMLLVEFGATAERGDIVLFPRGDTLVAHRLVARQRRHGVEMLIPKGDAEPYFDAPVRPDDLLGVVRALRRHGDAPATSLGCTGLGARLLARISYWSGRGAWLARRAASLLPSPLRRGALHVIPLLVRVTAHILFTPLLWAVLFRKERTEIAEGGEQHEAV